MRACHTPLTRRVLCLHSRTCLGLSLQAALHLIAADEVKHATGFQNLSSDAFASFNTLIGLVFSILLGQTYAANPDRPPPPLL